MKKLLLFIICVSYIYASQQEPAGTSSPTKSETEEQIAQRAVIASLGKNHEYLARLLTRALGQEAQEAPRKSRTQIKKELQEQQEEGAKKVLATLSSTPDDIESQLPTKDRQDISSWIVTNILQAKLKDREELERSNKVKYGTIIGAVIVQITVGLMQYFISHPACQNSQ